TGPHGKLPHGYWWLSGDGISRKQLPAGWKGMCTIGYLTSQNKWYNQSQIPQGILRSLLRKIKTKREENPLVILNTHYHSFIRWFIASLGVSELEKAIVNISATIDRIVSSTADAIQGLQIEVNSLSKVVLQNRMVLDLLTIKGGGVCAVINQSCCAYINQEGRIEDDLEKIWEKNKILYEVSKDNTSWGFEELWNKLTSWLPNWNWLKQLFVGIITLIILGIIICMLLRCFLWCHRDSEENYSNWKRHRIRHQVETGKYFAQTLQKDGLL
ncbi:endogenous retroviral envelope protein HEMO-like, partial [Larus michahellis]